MPKGSKLRNYPLQGQHSKECNGVDKKAVSRVGRGVPAKKEPKWGGGGAIICGKSNEKENLIHGMQISEWGERATKKWD